jgi:ABC-type transporter Mla subunit MlaD
MTSLEKARERFDKALVRLETAARAFAGRAGDAKMHVKLNEGLTEALQATQAEYAALRDVTGTVSRRLDETIDRLRNALES